jgi:hypothetical protein
MESGMRSKNLFFLIVCLLASTIIIACGSQDSGVKKDKHLEILKKYGFDIYAGAEFIEIKKGKEVGQIAIYKIDKGKASHDKLVKYYKDQLDKSSLKHGLPYGQKITIDGKKFQFTGVGGMDFTHTVVIFISKPENKDLEYQMIAVKVK